MMLGKRKKGFSREGMRHVANVLMCPHKWGEKTKVRVVDAKRKKPIDGELQICSICGTNKVEHDGIASLYPAQGLTTKKPEPV